MFFPLSLALDDPSDSPRASPKVAILPSGLKRALSDKEKDGSSKEGVAFNQTAAQDGESLMPLYGRRAVLTASPYSFHS